MKNLNCIIYLPYDYKFWNGSQWVSEYPNAERYSKTAAIKLARKLKKEQFLIGCDVVMNYGLETEVNLFH